MRTNKSQTVNITVPQELLKRVDALAKRSYTSRSDIVRQALLKEVRDGEVDEWGDPVGLYKTIIDFREINRSGVPIEEVIDALKKIERDEQNRKTATKTQSKTA